jgi:hypothetical protein
MARKLPLFVAVSRPPLRETQAIHQRLENEAA